MKSDVIYEVNIQVGESIQSDFLGWLKPHIAEMESIPGFLHPTEVLQVELEDSGFELSVRYRLESLSAMDNYLENHADRMRGDLPENFKSHLKFNRRILQKFDF